jgi:hypothetical protein
MNFHCKIDRSWLHYSIAGAILFGCTACGSPSEKIIGIWKTSFNCTSKQGVNVSYTGATSFSETSAEDRGSVMVSSADNQGKITKIVAKVESTSNWYIDNNKLTRAGYRSNFTISSVERGSENLYSATKDLSPYPTMASADSCHSVYMSGNPYNKKFCYVERTSEKQKAERNRIQARQAIATEANAELEREAAKYNTQELEIVNLGGNEMSVKQRNGANLYDFHYTAVCERQDFKKLTQQEAIQARINGFIISK